MFSHKHYQKLALEILASYLKETTDRGLVLDTNYDVCKVDAKPDADFLGYIDMRILLILHVLIYVLALLLHFMIEYQY